MGDETIQFALRFETAMSRLARLAAREPGARRSDRAQDPAAVADALDAVEAVYGIGTQAVRNWPEQRQRVLAQVGAMRETLSRAGVGDEVRRMARALLDLVERSPARE